MESSKLGRVVGIDAGAAAITGTAAGAPRSAGKDATEHELIGDLLTGLVAEVRRLDPLARADVPDAVHQLRTACRRVRGILSTFASSFDQGVTDPVRDELRWIRNLLGHPRDLEVQHVRLTGLVAAEPAQLVRGRPDEWIDDCLRPAHRDAHRAAVDAMTSDRYFALVDVLESWRDAPPWADRPDRPARKRLARSVDVEWEALQRTVNRAARASEDERPRLLHDVRKAAKRARFAADALEPVAGADARAVSRTAKKIQRTLGRHHDAVVAAHRVLELADAAFAEGRDTFTFGVLLVRLETEMAVHEQAFEETWRKATKKSRRKSR